MWHDDAVNVSSLTYVNNVQVYTDFLLLGIKQAIHTHISL